MSAAAAAETLRRLVIELGKRRRRAIGPGQQAVALGAIEELERLAQLAERRTSSDDEMTPDIVDRIAHRVISLPTLGLRTTDEERLRSLASAFSAVSRISEESAYEALRRAIESEQVST